MSEPGRLLDETDSELERLLLGVGRSEKSSAEARRRTLAALGIAGSATLATTAAAAAAVTAAPATALGKLTWAKLLVGLSALGVVAAVPTAYRTWQRRPVVQPTSTSTSTSTLTRARPATAAPGTANGATGDPLPMPLLLAAPVAPREIPPSPAPAPVAAPMPVPVLRAVSSAPATAPVTHAARPAGNPASLTRELGALDAIRAALARGAAPHGLKLLDTYARTYPQGRLVLEAEILRIDALARTGHAAGARDRAEAFLHRHPNSVLAVRARRYLDD